jgi:hypothetical protein
MLASESWGFCHMTCFVRYIDDTLATDFPTVGRIYEVLRVEERDGYYVLSSAQLHYGALPACLCCGGRIRLRPTGLPLALLGSSTAAMASSIVRRTRARGDSSEFGCENAAERGGTTIEKPAV